jgi:hypothetical protein
MIKAIHISSLTFLIASTYAYSQTSTEKSDLQLAVDVFEAYGAKQNFSIGLKNQLEAIRSQDPNIPAPLFDAFVVNASREEFFIRLAKPLAAKFTRSELEELIHHFKSSGFQKAVSSNNFDPSTLTQEERQNIINFQRSDVGIKFSKEWPTLKDEFNLIIRQWMTESYKLAVEACSHKKTKKK